MPQKNYVATICLFTVDLKFEDDKVRLIWFWETVKVNYEKRKTKKKKKIKILYFFK